MRNNQSIMQQFYKVRVLGQTFLQLHIRSAENPDNFCGKTLSRRAVCNCREKILHLIDFITFNSRLLLKSAFLWMLLKLGTGNGERGTGNGGERGTGNGERGTGNGERRTGNGERVYSGNPPENSKWRRKRRLQTPILIYCQVAVCSVIRRLAFI